MQKYTNDVRVKLVNIVPNIFIFLGNAKAVVSGFFILRNYYHESFAIVLTFLPSPNL